MTGFKATPEVLQAMLAKADEKLSAARRDLQEDSYGEVASRAYYAAYHAVCAVLAFRGMVFSSHSETLGCFNREFVKTGRFPANTTRKLQEMFENRQTADYDWERHIDASTAQRAFADAESLVNACRVFLGQHAGRTPEGKS